MALIGEMTQAESLPSRFPGTAGDRDPDVDDCTRLSLSLELSLLTSKWVEWSRRMKGSHIVPCSTLN